MKDVRVPGVLWALILIALIALIHENETVMGLDPVYVDVIVLALIGLLKTISLGDEQLQQALNIIDNIRNRVEDERVRGTAQRPGGLPAESGATEAVPALVVKSVTASAPPRPNRTVRWLVG